MERLAAQAFDGRFQPVCHFTQAHCAGQPGTAFQGVQDTQGLVARAEVVGPSRPLAQSATELRKQVDRFLFEYRKQVGVQRIGLVKDLIGDRDDLRGPGLELGAQTRRHRRSAGQHRTGRCRYRAHLRRGRFSRRVVLGQCVSLGNGKLGRQDGVERQQGRRVGVFQETGGKLVQQTTDVLAGEVENPCMLGPALAVQLHMLQGLLECARHLGQRMKTNRAGATAKRMGQPDGGVAHRLIQLQRPFVELRQQAA